MSDLFGESTTRVEDSFRIRLPPGIADLFDGTAYIKLAFEAADQLFETRDGKAWTDNPGIPYLELHHTDSLKKYFSEYKTDTLNRGREELWEARDIIRRLISCKIEKKQRRLTLNRAIRHHLNIKVGDEILILGFGGYVEIWTPENYEKADLDRYHEN